MRFYKKALFDLDCLDEDLGIYGPGDKREDNLRSRIRKLKDIIKSVYSHDDDPTWPMDFTREIQNIVKRYYEIKQEPKDLA